MEGGGRGQSVESGCKGRRRVTNGGIQKVPSFLVLKQEVTVCRIDHVLWGKRGPKSYRAIWTAGGQNIVAGDSFAVRTWRRPGKGGWCSVSEERFVLSFSSGVRGYEEPTRGIVSSSSSSRCRLRVWEKRNPNPFSEDVECVRKAGGWGPADTES
ncbi:hypothetical protein BHM03_00017921 [Ensete ventricosum]|nr:hypothetical protein BHM03_00017921 [Ensete ventricosum]